MSKLYPLEWLDSLVLYTFNPKKTDISTLSNHDLSLISENVFKESQKIQIHLKNEIFSLHKKRQIRLLVRKYHSTLVFLLDNIVENQKNAVFQVSNVSKISDVVIGVLDELISFVENRFSYYLSLDERAPITYLMVSRNELQLRLNRLTKKKITNKSDEKTIDIIIELLSQSLGANREFKVTYRQIRYYRELLKSLESLDYHQVTSNFFSFVDELLISINFNSPQYIDCLTNRINTKLTSYDLQNKVSNLLLYYKEFNQLYSNEKNTFDPTLQNIKYVLSNWFKYEIDYLERQITVAFEVGNDIVSDKKNKIGILDSKIECDLSIDQMALILRATDEARVVKSRSMNHFFKMVVPHLATPFKVDLSYQSVRSKSYTPEERDKEIAIKTLEKIITKIQ